MGSSTLNVNDHSHSNCFHQSTFHQCCCCICFRELRDNDIINDRQEEPRSRKCSLKSFHHLSSYFNDSSLHDNVHQSDCDVSDGATTTTSNNPNSAYPKLIYTLITGPFKEETSEDENQAIWCCAICHDDLLKLDQLHQNLQRIKRELSTQVKVIREQRNAGNWNNTKPNKNDPWIWKKGNPVEEVSGSSTGKGNVASTLSFLTILCDGLSSNHGNNQDSCNFDQDIQLAGEEITTTNGIPFLASSNPHFNSSMMASNPSFSMPEDLALVPVKCESYRLLDESLEEDEQDLFEVKHEDTDETGNDSSHHQPSDDIDDADYNHNHHHSEEEQVHQRHLRSSLPIISSRQVPFEEAASSTTVYSIPSENHDRKKKGFQLQRTKRKQRKERPPFRCITCHKTFSKKTILNIHSRIHSGERPYQCHLCPKRFSQHGGLSKHMVTHTGEKKFKCEICDKRFTQGGALNRHMKLHRQ